MVPALGNGNSVANSRLTAGELVPLADRVRYMLVVRLVMIGAVALGAVWAPGLIGRPPHGTPEVLGAWAVASLMAELIRRVTGWRALPLFGATLILDGAILVWFSVVGSVTNVRYLIFLHVVSVVLLASYRTGLKVVLWYTLLISTAFFGARQGILGLRPAGPGTVAWWDLGQLAVFVGAVWAVAVATAGFSSVNERELRRRRIDLEALAQFAVSLEDASDRPTVASTLLDSLDGNFPVGRLLLVSAGRRPTTLGSRGTVEMSSPAPARLEPPSAILTAQTTRQTLLLSKLDPVADPWISGIMEAATNLIVVPLFAEGGCVGALLAEHSTRSGSRVERRLVAILERFASHTALALRNAGLLEQMERMANTDGLTNIANRRTFQINLEKEMARSIRSGQPVGLIMLDIDNFKLLNDSKGHQVGDEVLREVAVALQACSREFDTIARYGGEEFAVILPGAGPEEARFSAERLHRIVSESVSSAPITVSVGVACVPAHAQTAHLLLKAADDALYLAKRAGRNRVCTADPGLGSAISPTVADVS